MHEPAFSFIWIGLFFFDKRDNIFDGIKNFCNELIFKNFSTTGDGILAGLKVIECIKYYGKSLSELAKEVKLMPQILNNIVVKVKHPFEDIKVIQTALNKANKDLEGKGRVLLRYSGTENLARVMVEGDDQDLVDKTCSELSAVVKKELAWVGLD